MKLRARRSFEYNIKLMTNYMSVNLYTHFDKWADFVRGDTIVFPCGCEIIGILTFPYAAFSKKCEELIAILKNLKLDVNIYQLKINTRKKIITIYMEQCFMGEREKNENN